ncbi:MAG TPA: hypothetical protein VMX55_03210 [candidate division Zixibacteria bacterium]|nr:hypothetical protein [candidate division Zixibacteria bacterium]
MIPIYENQSGWLDEAGNIGYHLKLIKNEDETYYQEPDGNPVGDWQYITINDAICMNCNIIYGIVNRKIESTLKNKAEKKSEQFIINNDDLEFIEGTIAGHKIMTTKNKCPKCQEKLLTASELVEKTILRKPSRILGLTPSDIVGEIHKCPICKDSDLLFDYAIRYH